MSNINSMQKYHKLSSLEKALMRLVSLIYGGATVDSLLKCLNKLNYLSDDDRNIKTTRLLNVLSDLKKKKWIESKHECPRELAHPISIDAFDSGYGKQYVDIIESVQKEVGLHGFYLTSFNSYMVCMYRLRRSIYSANEPAILDDLKEISKYLSIVDIERLFMFLYENAEVSVQWLSGLPIIAQERIFNIKLRLFCFSGADFDQLEPLLTHYQSKRDIKEYKSFASILLVHDILSGQVEHINKTASMDVLQDESKYSALGTADFFLQNFDASLMYYAEGLKIVHKQTRNRKTYFQTIDGVFHMLGLLKAGSDENWSKLQTHLDYVLSCNSPYLPSYCLIQDMLWNLQGKENLRKRSRHSSISGIGLCDLDPISSAIKALYDYWFDRKNLDLKSCDQLFSTYGTSLPLVAKIFADVLLQTGKATADQRKFLSQTKFKNMLDFISIIQVSEQWERKLQQLTHFFERISGTDDVQKQKRLVWEFDPEDLQSLMPIEQSQKVKGGWSKGRSVSRRRLFEKARTADLDYLTSHDHKLISTLKRNPYRYNYGASSEEYEWNELETPLALVGHPRVFCEATPGIFVEFIESTPELSIEECDKDHFMIRMSYLSPSARVIIEQETPSRFKVINFSEQYLPLMNIIGLQGLKVSASAKDTVVDIIRKAAPILTIHTELESEALPSIDSDSTPCLQLLPMGEGLRINLFVRPFTDKGAYLRPGQGKPSVMSEIDGKYTRACRDLKKEKQLVGQLLKECSCLRLNNDDTQEWIFENPNDCLNLLSEIQDYKGPLKTEWPEGQIFSVTRPVSFSDFSINISQKNDWFEVQGKLKIGENQVLDMRVLLDLLESSEGNFVALGDRQFLSLSKHFKKRLRDLQAFSEATKSGAKIHGLGSLTLRDFAGEAGNVKSDKHWKQTIKTLQEVEKYQPQLPSTLQADLREYQVEGFEWLSRLAKAGMGACLADDMGLGKTIQALAVMLSHAAKGPCLVVAPTSVCHNWEDEARKFAPTLNIHTLPLKKRKEFVETLGINDVLVCSYGIMQQAADVIHKKTWQMVVLDEAQAIKNPTAKRSQVAVKLQGRFKLALTGTPIENDLDELWSLFRFVAPGLLGSRESFRARFAIPIQQDKNSQVQNSLRLLVQTFILRRTKNKVLTELPPRTEQTLIVEMTEEERSFYEALRRKAVERIHAIDEGTQAGQKRFHILAEMTRLRQACCHPQLVTDDIAIKSSKLKILLRLIDDLRQNNHQALIFSQYVRYLKLVRQELDDRGIRYRYLDGSTPAGARKKEAQAFQAGETDIFLISLKAGGAGLNLTAADYVIHLDPWWNPAVEDQASDRAHRIGQTRPVTVYRLIMQNSIEEKIMSLHQTKRDLADALLKGSNVWQRLSEDQLIALIQGAETPETQLTKEKMVA